MRSNAKIDAKYKIQNEFSSLYNEITRMFGEIIITTVV